MNPRQAALAMLLGALICVASPSMAGRPASEDVPLVADALERRAATLTAACGESTVDDALVAAAEQLTAAQGGVAVAAAVANAVRTVELADAAAEVCAQPLPHLAAPPRSITIDPVRRAELVNRLQTWGEPEAAHAWARLIATDPTSSPKQTLQCRCFGDAVRGVPVLYGAFSAEAASRWRRYSLLGEVVLGGCVEGPPLVCPDGCWPDIWRPGDPELPPRDIRWRSLDDLQVGVAGVRPAVPAWTPDPRAHEALSGCLGDRELARARRDTSGAWTAWGGSDRDVCLAAWAAEHLLDPQIDRLAVTPEEASVP
jgi:hypothetical protein